MLELKEITKNYEMNGSRVEALRGISLAFRDSEFVAILGHSGCRKDHTAQYCGRSGSVFVRRSDHQRRFHQAVQRP